MSKRVLSRILEEIKKKSSWGKNELIELFARIQAEEIDREIQTSTGALPKTSATMCPVEALVKDKGIYINEWPESSRKTRDSIWLNTKQIIRRHFLKSKR